MTGSARHGVGVSTGSLRAPVAESSRSGLKLFCGRFLDAATARSMTGVRHGVGVSTLSFRAPVAESSHSGLKLFRGHFLDAATARSMTGSTQHDRDARNMAGCTQHGGGLRHNRMRAQHDKGGVRKWLALPTTTGQRLSAACKSSAKEAF